MIASECHVDIGNIQIRKAKKFLVIPLFQIGRPLSETKQRDENRFIELLHLAFAEHSFFFSTTFDLTLTQQRQHFLPKGNLEPLWMRADSRFFWNRNTVVDLIAADANEWIIPFMSAYVEVRPECEVEGEKFTLLLISRRSRFRQGCRFTKRGIDETGSCANFVETEQIAIFPDGKLTSFVQIRGSIPVKWSSPVLMKYEPPVYIEDNKLLSQEFADKHVKGLLELYADENKNSEIVFINLIDNKKDQGKLGVHFKETIDYVKKQVSHPLHFIWFDYHHECKQKGKEKNIVKLVQQISEFFNSQKYFCKLANGTVTSFQKGVFRTNCMDNLDRTNVVQSVIARRSLFIQLGKNNVYNNNFLYSLESPYKKFELIFRTIWVNNADAISFAYAGTGALKTDVVKKGKRSWKGMYNDGVNSLMRYYINNFKDGSKQDSIDLVLGNYQPDSLHLSPFIDRPEHESLADVVTKLFLLLLILFSLLLFLTSFPLPSAILSSLPSIPAHYYFSSKLKLLSNNLIISMTTSMLIMFYISYKVIKKGSRIGESLVCHPQLVREPIRLLS